MAICPKCQSSIEIQPQFFGGLFTCPKCQAVYFTNFDGVPEGSTEQGLEPSNFNSPPLSQDAPMAYQDSPPISAPQEEFENQMVIQPDNINNQMEPQFSSEPEQTPMETSSADKLNDVVRYGNSDQASSPMSYRLVINGLDIIQNVNELKEVISDAKLQLSFSELKRKIQNGQLVIEGLSPAKAAVIAQRIRALNLSMKWELKIYE